LGARWATGPAAVPGGGGSGSEELVFFFARLAPSCGTMNPTDKPLVYLILGAAGSGRREVLHDLIETGLAAEDRAVVLLADTEASAATDAQFPALERWVRNEETIAAEFPSDATHVFFVADGRADPADQVEAFKSWLEQSGGELARVLCVVNCRLAEQNPPLLAWYDACVFFADVVFLNEREGVANKWMSDFQARYTKEFYPCLFELVKKGRVKNPALILEPEARRMTHVFDEEQDWIVTGEDGETVEDDDENEGEEEVTAVAEPDPFLERRQGGRRVKELPDIEKFLPPRA